MVTEREWTLGGVRAMPYRDDVLWKYTAETCILVLTSVAPLNLILKMPKKKKKSKPEVL